MRETQVAMARQSLVEYFRPDSRPSNEIALAWRRGYRTVRWSYADLLRVAGKFAAQLQTRGIGKGDRVLLWGENSGEWVAAFLGCLFRGAIAVPMDAISERGFAQRVAQQAGVRLAVIGRGLPSLDNVPAVTSMEELDEPADSQSVEALSPAAAGRGDPIEIVFTSGTTAQPRGVVLTHRNLLANLEPLEKEIARYRRYERIFHPLRFLNLLPLSHVFGQLLGIFLPQIVGATSVFVDTLNPADIIRTIREERVSVLVTVPRLIESLRDQVERDLGAHGRLTKFQKSLDATEGEHFLKRWWRFRAIHRKFGWRFWTIISGGAALPAAAEEFWTRLGYAVVQGYGLTETTSLVSVNHPFRLGRGSIGKTLPGLEVKLAEDGEILVRGENVAAGYWRDAGNALDIDQEGWFHTGDLGERGADGNLYFKGRRKSVIVMAEGLKVYPDDLEVELRKEPGVRDCVVVGIERDGNAEACAVLLLREGHADDRAAASEIVRRANERLAPFQQMRRWVVWPEQDFPRTPTQKPMIGRIREKVESETSQERSRETASVSGSLGDVFLRISRGRPLPESGTATLPLSSIERVELMSALEDRYQVDLSETDFASADSVQALERLVEQPQPRMTPFRYPRWPQRWPMRIFRAVVLNSIARSAMFLMARPRIQGSENLRDTAGPVLVIANHVTFLDPAYVLKALPAHLRRRLAVAMDGELLESMRNPPRGKGFFASLLGRIKYFLLLSIFNVFPLPRQAGFRKSFAFAGDLIDRGWSVLVFPEGELTRDGRTAPFRAGIGLLATRLDVPVVAVRLDGLFELRAAGKRWAHPGRVRVSIGVPVRFRDTQPAEEIARDLERSVAALQTVQP
jgi:long-chain acyl-CoA synthetase